MFVEGRIAWGFLARDNDSIKADLPFGLRHIFHRQVSILNFERSTHCH